MAFINFSYGLKLLYTLNTGEIISRLIVQVTIMALALLAHFFRHEFMGLHPSTILFVIFIMYRT